ncbi:MAG: outer membrane beta-barrel protein [Thermoguttaceae bacterium]
MKLLNRVALIAMSVAIMFIATENPTWAADSIRQPASAVRTAYEYDNYPNTDLPQVRQDFFIATDANKTQETPAAEQPSPNSSQETMGSNETAYAAPPDPPKPWHLPQPCIFQEHNITMGGWLQQGITFNNLRPADGFNGPNYTNDLDRQYQLNQFWVFFNRPTNTDGCGMDLGGRVDVVYGTDWRFGQCYGLETRFDDSNSFYGLILPQFYMEVAINDLKIKLGHFATFTSYEVIPAPMNFFYSDSYLMGGYFDPLLVTGMQGEYKLNDNWTLIGGINRGWMMFEDPTNSWNFLGGGKWTSSDKKSTLSLMVDAGDQVGFTGLRSRNTCYIVYTHQLTEKLLYASQYDIGQEVNGSVVTPGQNANYYGLEQVLIYKLNDKWSAGVRYEWACDEEGSRVAGIGTLMGTDKGWQGQPGFAGSFHDVTIGLNYRPNPNFVFRPCVRWDSYDGLRNPANQYPYGNFDRTSQFTFAMDLITTF